MLFGYIIIKGMISYHAAMPFHNFSSTELAQKGYTGIAGPLLSTIMVIFLVFIFSIPLAIGTAMFVSEYGRDRWWGRSIVMFALVCNGIPSIVFGILGMLIFVVFLHINHTHFSILATALILTLVILPTLFMGVYESIMTVKNDIRVEAFALGATKFQTMRLVLLRAAITGILDAFAISIVRAIGESAPVLFTIGSSNFVPNSAFDSGNTLTLLLFQQFQNAAPASFLYSLALVIFMLMIGVYLFLAIIRICFFSENKNIKFPRLCANMLALFDLKKQSTNFKWMIYRLSWQIRALFVL